MSENLPAVQARPLRFTRDDLPKRGDWYHVTYRDKEWNSKTQEYDKIEVTLLMCVEHIGSNFVEFSRARSNGTGTWSVKIPMREVLERTKLEPNWKALIDKEFEEKQKELADTIRSLADKVHQAQLLPEDVPVSDSMLPSTTRHDPKESKKALTKLKDKTLPKAKEDVERLTQEMVGLQRDMVLPMLLECDRMTDIKEKIEERLFVLELYAGLWEDVTQIAEGEPAAPETPITIRQMIRYMDEECLFDFKCGGMDYSKLSKFDAWLAKPENYQRLLPEERCVVAFRVRRAEKQYDVPSTFAGFLELIEKSKANMQTYLCIRNGTTLWRLATEVDFHPRLLPLESEMHSSFVEKDEHGWYDRAQDKRVYKEPELITPEDLRYDEHVEKRQKTVFKYNRILFLLQGILDRSKALSPHPPINLGDPSAVATHIRTVFDEEKGLPSANPPKWEEVRDAANKKIRPGTWVYAYWEEEREYGHGMNYRSYITKHNGIYEVTQVRKDRSAVRISWPWGTRTGWEHPEGWYSGYGKWGEWEVKKMRHRWVPMVDVYNVEAYKIGDYKPFLCDAYLKGAYLEWAPQLLSAESWHQEKQAVEAKAAAAAINKKLGRR